MELAFPWKALAEHARHAGPPDDGEQWRINFSRVEWQITHTNGAYQKIPNLPEDNWVWSPQGVVDMHRPEMWGVVQFTRQSAKQKTFRRSNSRQARARVWRWKFITQRHDFCAEHKGWATNRA